MPRRREPQLALGTAVQLLRSRAGLSQAALAGRVGLTTSTLSRIEGGQTNPKYGTVRKLAATLGVSLTELATLAESLGDESESECSPR